MLQKKALEEQLQEFTRTLAQRDELIAQLRAGREVHGTSYSTPRLMLGEASFNLVLICLAVGSHLLRPCLKRPESNQDKSHSQWS